MDIAKTCNQKISLTLIRIFNGWLCKMFGTVIANNIAVLKAKILSTTLQKYFDKRLE